MHRAMPLRVFVVVLLGWMTPFMPALAGPVSGFREARAAAPVFYVATQGNDSNPGTLALPWRTINHAVKATNGAPAGATVYVKAGNYGAENVVFERDGISLIGYTHTPGDQPPILANASINPGNGTPSFPAFKATEMPLLDGGNRAHGIGIDITGRRHITLRNVNIMRFSRGVIAGKAGDRHFIEAHRLDNVNVSSIGDTSEDYDGDALGFGSLSTVFSNGNVVRNSLIINAAAEGLNFVGNDNLADNVRVYCTDDRGPASTDYYIMVMGSYNEIRNSYIWRKPGSDHSGHGYSVKDNRDQLAGGPPIDASYNLFENNVAVNMGEGFVVRHRGAKYNIFRRNIAYGPFDGQAESCNGGNGITIRDGASYNTFINTQMINTCDSISMGESEEDEASPVPAYVGSHNRIIRAKVTQSYFGVVYQSEAGILRNLGDNTIEQSTFDLVRFMFYADLPSTKMRYIHSRFGGTEDTGNADGFFLETARGGRYVADVVRSQFPGSRFHNFDMPSGW